MDYPPVVQFVNHFSQRGPTCVPDPFGRHDLFPGPDTEPMFMIGILVMLFGIDVVVIVAKDRSQRGLRKLRLIPLPESPNLPLRVELEQCGDVEHQTTMTVQRAMQSHGFPVNHFKSKGV